MHKEYIELSSSPFAKFLALGLGLLFLGRQEDVEPIVRTCIQACQAAAHTETLERCIAYNKVYFYN